MGNPLLVSWVVSGIGMLMLFVALAVLYGLIYLMTAVIRDKPGPAAPPAQIRGLGAAVEEHKDRHRKQQAAAIAVALARAELQSSPASAPGPAEAPGASPWRAFHQQRFLTQPQRMRRFR